MATIDPILRTEDLDSKFVVSAIEQNTHPEQILFDSDCDCLTVLYAPPETETVVHYLKEDEFALLFDPETRMIVGFQIEAFLRSYSERHAGDAGVQAVAGVARQLAEYGDLVVIHEEPRPTVADPVREIARQIPHQILPDTGPLSPLVTA